MCDRCVYHQNFCFWIINLIFLNKKSIVWVLVFSMSDKDLAPCSIHFRKISSCSRWVKIQRDPQLDTEQREADFSALSLKWDVFVKLLLPRLREMCGRGSRKVIRTEVIPWKQCHPRVRMLMHIWTRSLWQHT